MAIGDPEWVQDQINAAMAQQSVALPPAMPRASPDDGTRPGWLSLFGEALGGGQTPGYRLRGREEDAAGSRALLNFGIQTLLASGPQRVRPDVLSAVATGLQGAQQSIDVDQRRAGAAAQADYNQRLETAKLGVEQGRDKIERLKAVLPLLQMQRVQGSQLPWETSSAAPAGTPAPPVDKATFLQQTAKRESGGDPTALNYVAQQDPTAYDRGATASGKYQIVNSTWREGLQLAGLDPSKYATARDAPEKVQDQVASAIYDKYGTKPWQKGAKDWVKDEQGRYQLATVRPAAGAPGAPAPAPASPPAPRPPPAPPAPDAGNQFSGPGVPTGGAVQPPSPAVAGDVAAIQAGMDQARAAPGVQVAQAGPPAATPGVAPSPGADDEFDAYRAKRPIRFTPEQEATFKIAPDQGTLATLAQQERIAMQEAAIARRNGDQAGIDKATAAWQSIQTAKAKALDEATEKGRAARAAAAEAEIGRQYKDFEAARNERREAAKEDRAQERAIAMERLKAENTAKQNVDSAVLNVSQKRLEELQGKSAVAQRTIRDLHALETMADQMGDQNALIANNPKLRDYLISLKLPGLVGANMNELQAGQLWDKLTSGFFQDTHVPGSGSQSDREGEWMMRQFGGPEQTTEDRHSQLAIIRKLADNRIADHSDAEDLFTQQGGKLTGLNAKIAQRSKLFDRPPEWKPDDPDNIKTQGRYMMRHPRGEPYAARTADGELRFYRNEMVKNKDTGRSRLEAVPLLGGSMVAE